MTAEILKERQGWTLDQKIDHSLGVIDQYYSKYNGMVYLAFSGGKDSTVLMHLCEYIDKDIPCVFVNTGCEYPDIVKFVCECKTDGHNIIMLHPKMHAREVWSKYGFPLGSKEIAENVAAIRRNPHSVKARKALGQLGQNSVFVLKKKWHFLIKEKFDTSNKCCQILKKNPSEQFVKETGRMPIDGVMASESLLREKTYIRNGACNVFGDKPKSRPLSIWTDEDIWAYIDRYHIKIADIYGKGVKRTGCVACGFGCQFKCDHRFEILHDLYPKYYDMVLKFENNGVPYRIALRKVLAMNNKLLPDESLF